MKCSSCLKEIYIFKEEYSLVREWFLGVGISPKKIMARKCRQCEHHFCPECMQQNAMMYCKKCFLEFDENTQKEIIVKLKKLKKAIWAYTLPSILIVPILILVDPFLGLFVGCGLMIIFLIKFKKVLDQEKLLRENIKK